jgi:hypothetical protein
MNEFISNILNRHINPVTNIVPRLPGTFEPVNFPAANSVDLSAGIDTIREVSLPQGIKVGKDNNASFNSVATLTPEQNIISDKQFVQHTNAVFPENKNADQASVSKNIIPIGHEFYTDKKVDQKNSFERFDTQEIPIHSEIKAITIKPLNEKPVNDLEQQEMPGSVLINKLNDDTDIPAKKEGALHQHISILKQKIVKASVKKNNVAGDKKMIQAGLIKPLVNEQDLRTNPRISPVLNEQPMSTVIKVSIGRIEVRAVTNATPQKISRTVLQKPNLTLDDYLKRRNATEK